MRFRLGTPREAMVIAPHPDDEAIGAGNLIRALRRRGTRVHIVVVSDGAGSHRASRRWPRARLVAERRRETRRAMRRLGITAGEIRFLGLPDGSLPLIAARCRRTVARAIARCPRVDLLVGPAGDDDHPDHRAVAAAIAFSRNPSRRLAYRVWPPRHGRRGHGLVIAGTASAKRSLIRGYRTQCGGISDDPAGFGIARHELDAFSHPIEWFEQVRR